MPIQWRDKMSVGSRVLDEDHKRLIDILNTFEQMTRNGASFEALDQIFQELADYTRDHFAREERIQQEINYPLRQTHQEQHRAMVAWLLKAYKTYKARRQAAEARGVSSDHDCYEELLSILNTWLTRHILQEDMKLKPHLQRHLEAAAMSDV
ncbi:Hemerythrin [Caenispirillum salinarum AK4]|uniref:Hemerythrin n=1 Tax=Caenispirillum salinarum AK4 TaxID=1238182 RepID=K9GTL7_9PROT|nr:bacteriohemerythrin [Caenispirillum salinarum]EKV28099.1 Hemerythrin [Caenispirillum salinarum AK4]